MNSLLSVILLTHNEEELIGNCLHNLLNFREKGGGWFIPIEIIVIDSYSTDRTKKITKGFEFFFDIKFIQKEFTNFSDARNLALQHCESESKLVLMVDADETFDSDLQWMLQDIMNRDAIAWWFPRIRLFPDKYHFLHREYPDPQMRLFKKINGIKFENPVHEILTYNGQQIQPDGKIGAFTRNCHFYHWDLLQSKEKLIAKTERWEKLKDKNNIPTGSFIFKPHEHPYRKLEDILTKENIQSRLDITQIDNISERIDKGNKNYKEADERRINKIIELASGENQKIVDIGCSGGDISIKLAKNNDVIAIDCNEKTIQDNIKKDNKVRWLVGLAEKTGLSNDFADVVILGDTLEHCEDYHKVLEEIKRIVKPTGKVIISVPNVDSQYELRIAAHHHLQYFWPDKLEKELKKYFSQVKFIKFFREEKLDAMMITEVRK